MNIKLNYRKILVSLVAVMLLIILWLVYCYLHIFETVIPQQIYRSKQLTAPEFAQVISKYHIKSIFNLRGAHPHAGWYDNEMGVSKVYKINHYDFALSSRQLPNKATLKNLVIQLKNAPRPILIHCLSGVDRSGLAAIITLILNNENDLKKLADEVSMKHFVLHQDSIGKQFLADYQRWLQKKELPSNEKNLLLFCN